MQKIANAQWAGIVLFQCVVGWQASFMGVAQAASSDTDPNREASTPASTPAPGLEEIVVTAVKRAEKSNDIGMSITALTGKSLDTVGVHALQDLTSVVPGFTVAQTPYGLPIYTLRGVGFVASNLADTPTVGTYIDEAAYAYPYMARGPSFDMQRVEVLKGPQGTLFGRNTTGGLISFVTNKPTNEFSAGFTSEFGNYETRNFEGYVNQPISENLQVRLAMRSEDSDEGWQHSFSRPSDTLGRVHRLGVRGEILAEPTDSVEDLFTVNYWRDRSDSIAGQYAGLLPGSGCVTAPATCTPGVLAYGSMFNAHGDPSVADWVPNYVRQAPGLGAGLNPLQLHQNFYGLANRLTWNVQENMSVVSLTSYNRYTRDDGIDNNGLPYNVESADSAGLVDSFQQELRLQGVNGPLNWMVGAYYAKDRISLNQVIGFNELSSINYIRAVGEEIQPSPILNPLGYTPAQIATALSSAAYYSAYTNEDKSVFAHADWKFEHNLTLTGGVRYTQNDLPFSGCIRDSGDGTAAIAANTVLRAGLLGSGINPGFVVPGGCTTFNAVTGKFDLVHEDLKESSVPWLVNLGWKPQDGLLLYGLVSRGYKEGAIPSFAASNSEQYTPARQEQLTNFELGEKATLFNERAQLNASVFYYRYKDKQTTGYTLDPVFGVLNRLVNIPNSRAYGLDADLTVRPIQSLTAEVGATYVKTKILDYSGLDALGEVTNYAGRPFSYVPTAQFSALLQYDVPISGKLAFTAHVDARYQTSSHADLQGLALYDIDSYGVLNGGFGIHTLDGRVSVLAWGKNLTNKYYITTVTGLVDTALAYPGMPRTFGATVSYRY